MPTGTRSGRGPADGGTPKDFTLCSLDPFGCPAGKARSFAKVAKHRSQNEVPAMTYTLLRNWFAKSLSNRIIKTSSMLYV